MMGQGASEVYPMRMLCVSGKWVWPAKEADLVVVSPIIIQSTIVMSIIHGSFLLLDV
jgi:hypothetical protein